MIYSYNSDFHKDFSILKAKTNQKKGLSFTKIEPSSIDFNEKSIIILCGNNSTSQSKAEFYAYLCRNWLENSHNNSNLSTYSIYYPNTQPLFNEDSSIKLDYKGLAREIFEQVIYKNKQVLAVEEIKKNLNNVIFFGHSAGGLVMDELMHNLGEMLSITNLSQADIKQIYKSIVFIAYAPYSLVKAPIYSVYVAPIYDTVGSTKLVYSKIIKSKSFVSSNPNLNILGENKLSTRGRIQFIKKYKEAINHNKTLYFANKNSLIATPNLLYCNERKEDHNFAGVIVYPNENPYQTEAGKLTAQFLSSAFNYSLSTNRENFNIIDLYEDIIKTNSTTHERNL